MSTRKLRAVVPTPNGEHDALVEYWKQAVGRYIKAKRAGKTQSQIMGTSRSAVSDLENGLTDFRLSRLLKTLDAVDGDISEAFAAKTHHPFQGRDHDLIDLLVELIETGNEKALDMARLSLEALHEKYVQRK